MIQFNTIYEENKKLDEIFDKLYGNYNKDIIKKNILELLVELGELANETRCMKYWSNKKPSNRDIILEEYADCMLMHLCFCSMVDVSLDESFETPKNDDVVLQFIYLYNEASMLHNDFSKDRVKRILINLIHLGRLLNFTDEDIISGCIKKIEKNKLRFETGF